MVLQKRVKALETKRQPRMDVGVLLVRPQDGETPDEAIARAKSANADFCEQVRKLTVYYIGAPCER